MTCKFLVPALAALLVVGCKPAETPSSAPSSSAPPASAPATAAQPPAEGAAPADDAVPGERVTVAQPGLKVTTVDGQAYDLAAHRGKWVVVNFWATWCAPCRKEMPELSALHAMRSQIEVVGLAYEEIEPQAMQAFLKERPVTYPIAIVDPFDPPADFATPRGLPLTYLIDPQGRLAHTFLGPVTATEIEQKIAM